MVPKQHEGEYIGMACLVAPPCWTEGLASTMRHAQQDECDFLGEASVCKQQHPLAGELHKVQSICSSISDLCAEPLKFAHTTVTSNTLDHRHRMSSPLDVCLPEPSYAAVPWASFVELSSTFHPFLLTK